MKIHKDNSILVKLLALFSVVRAYNIFVIVVALYISVLIIAPSEFDVFELFLNLDIHWIILASSLVVSAGYIINSFYDQEKDQLNTPIRSAINQLISQNFKLNTYIALNLLALLTALLASWRIFVFFLVYQILMWFYSHKLNKIFWINNLFFSLLAIMPFLAITLYFKNVTIAVFLQSILLFLLLLTIDTVKDLISRKSDLIFSYNTLVTEWGDKTTKVIITSYIVIAIVICLLVSNLAVSSSIVYFSLVFAVLLFLSIPTLWYSKTKTYYTILNNLFRALIIFGVASALLNELNGLVL